MAAYEGVPFPRHGAVEQVHAPEHGVRSEPAADLQHGTLDLPFFFEGVIVGKEVELIDAVIIFQFDRIDAETPIEEPVVGLPVKLFEDARPDNGDAVGGDGQPECPVTVVWMEPPVKIKCDIPVIFRTVFQAPVIVADPPDNGFAYDVFPVHVFTELVDHLGKGDPRFCIFISLWQHLSVGDAIPNTL